MRISDGSSDVCSSDQLLGAGSSNGGNRARRSRRTARRRLGNRASKRWFPAPRRYVRSPWGQRAALNREPRRIREMLFRPSQSRASRWVPSPPPAREHLVRKSGAWGKSESVRYDNGRRLYIKQKINANILIYKYK